MRHGGGTAPPLDEGFRDFRNLCRNQIDDVFGAFRQGPDQLPEPARKTGKARPPDMPRQRIMLQGQQARIGLCHLTVLVRATRQGPDGACKRRLERLFADLRPTLKHIAKTRKPHCDFKAETNGCRMLPIGAPHTCGCRLALRQSNQGRNQPCDLVQ